MQLKTILLPFAFLAVTILADNAAILASIADIQAKTLDLNTTVAKWKGVLDPLGTLPIIIKSTSLLATIDKGTYLSCLYATYLLPKKYADDCDT
jgi:hypothetical protein